jgi:hypothetical protein
MKLKNHTLPGSSLIIAVGITSIVFIAVIGMTAAILQSLRSSTNISYSNTAFYAAEAGVEKALYAIVGHTTGYQFTSDKITDPLDQRPIDNSIDSNTLINSSNDYLVQLSNTVTDGPTTGYVAYGRTDYLPSEDNVWLSIRDRSSATIGLSVDESPTPISPPNPAFAINMDSTDTGNTMLLYVDFFDGTPSDQIGEVPDYRINLWRGPNGPCYFQEEPTGPEPLGGLTANCPGWAYPGEVGPNDPDIGLTLNDYIFAYMPCSESGTTDQWLCPEQWTANPNNSNPDSSPYLPLDAPWPAGGGVTPLNLPIIRDANQALDSGASIWSVEDTYLIDTYLDPDTDGGRGWILQRDYRPSAPANDDLPDLTVKVSTDLDGDGTNDTLPVTELTPLKPINATYLDGTGTTSRSGSLAFTGDLLNYPREDDYLYIDACNQNELDCPDDISPNGVVSAPWNLEITITDKARTRTYKRRLRGEAGEIIDGYSCISNNTATTFDTDIVIDIDCLFPDGAGERFETDTDRDIESLETFLSTTASPVEIKITTNNLPVDIRLFIPKDADYTDFPLGGPDEKTTITSVGTSRKTHQILKTTIYQEETLPVFRSTTVF